LTDTAWQAPGEKQLPAKQIRTSGVKLRLANNTDSAACSSDLTLSRLAQRYAHAGGSPPVVVVPSYSMPADELAHHSDLSSQELRSLWTILLAARGRRIVFVSSMPVPPIQIEHLLQRLADPETARRNIVFLSADDASRLPLSQKILDRPHLQAAIRQSVDVEKAVLLPFVVTELEQTLAKSLDIELVGPVDDASYFGTKSGSRRIFAQSDGVEFPDGENDIYDGDGLVRALALLSKRNPRARRFVVKLNGGVSGLGNADLILDEAPPRRLGLRRRV
jgi:hypothetical protein